ncbi:MAG: glycolate oxidase subunit GlcF [Ectothiorhodospiraceae bacterium]|nr:glycolate oxidase subunit GlcF [Chromatiales bacterium]MCP5156032.1 glycolate oxidase subunit GlcF [Ectothiorhodospiraceae bacterium]
MQTNLADFIKHTPEGQEADAILRKCVHCGFCTATCPTYQLLGDELDGPRGRIYLIKEMLEGEPVSARTRLHLDRCLTCRACETTCPSGVRYGRLAEIGRHVVEQRAGERPLGDRLMRRALRAVLPYRTRFAPLLRLGQWLRPLLSDRLRPRIPAPVAPTPWPQARHPRRMLVLGGCVQPALAPDIDAAAARVLDRLGIALVGADLGGCCGAVGNHLGAHEEGLDAMRRNIDAWWPEIERGAEAVVASSSACALQIKEYGDLLAHDTAYAEKARRVAALARDLLEVVAAEDLDALGRPGAGTSARVAAHCPCTQQHGERLPGVLERVLTAAGYTLAPVPDGHLCCGSAGTYSVLQPELSTALLTRKVAALESGEPAVIATANIGCLTHLQRGASRPVRHWIRLLDERLGGVGR